MDERELVVGPDAAGERLDVFLAPAAGSRAAAQRLIEAGLVLVDGAVVPKRHAVAAGERVVVRPAPEAEEPAVPDATYAIAYEDEHLLVIDKPAGVVVHPARRHRAGTLVQALTGRVAGGDDPRRPGIVHRLDRDTSGLLVVARTEAAHAALKDMLRRREVTREYLALVEGRPAARAGTIDAPLGRDRRVRTRISTDTDEPREAITHFEVEADPRGLHPAARAARDRPHAPDPRAPAGDRPSGGRRSGVRPRGAARPRAAVPARRAARLPAPGDGGGDRRRSPLPDDLQRALSQLS